MRVDTVIIYNNYILTIIIIIETGRVDEQDPREVRVRDFKFGGGRGGDAGEYGNTIITSIPIIIIRRRTRRRRRRRRRKNICMIITPPLFGPWGFVCEISGGGAVRGYGNILITIMIP